MTRRDDRPVDLAGTIVTDAATGTRIDLGDLPAVTLLSAIRHRY